MLNSSTQHYECDKCGKVQRVSSYEWKPWAPQLVLLEKAYGWTVVKGIDKHYCPNCKPTGYKLEVYLIGYS